MSNLHSLIPDCRLQHEISTREQLWSKSSDLDERLSKLTERNERLVDDLRDSENAAATANGQQAFVVACLQCVQ